MTVDGLVEYYITVQQEHSVFIHNKPEIAHRYWSAVEKGDLAAAAGIIGKYEMPLFKLMKSGFAAGGDAVIHGMMELAGICLRWRRKPLPSLDDKDMGRLKAFLYLTICFKMIGRTLCYII